MGPQELYGPAQGVITHGLSQAFDYGFGTSMLALLALSSIALNFYCLRFIFTTVKDLSILIGQLKEILHDHS